MPSSLNLVQLIGRLGRDPEMRFVAEGQAVTTFSLATARYGATATVVQTRAVIVAGSQSGSGAYSASTERSDASGTGAFSAPGAT